uniref:Protection of telomeres protein 1 n=1 Tax=Leptobrachium leishanense TaxID=445787 RepID=A0A8C5PPF2_9ANUR
MTEECEKVIRQGGDTVAVCDSDLTRSPSTSKSVRRACQTAEDKESEVYAPAPKYSYTPFEQLKEGMVANVFGVVKFFKPPYRSKGTDFCSVVTVVDQTDVKLRCVFFSGNADLLPKVYQVGDIGRFHRIKIQSFNGELQGISTCGFSALVFDGALGAPVTPRTTSKVYSFTDDDRKRVDILREWAANHNIPESRVKLSAARPLQYFDLICHLVGKAEVDKTSYLLKVWDGTKCSSAMWKVCVEGEALEGDRALIKKLCSLTADILVYDNHVETAKLLKVGSIIVIHSIHTKLHAANENETGASYLEFYLHGGTVYGRGITVLPENSYEAQEFKKFLDSVDLSEYQSPEEAEPPEVAAAVTSHQEWEIIPLARFIKSKAPNKCRIRARLRRFQPQNLCQSVKLHCPKCKSLRDVPNEKELSILFQERFSSCPSPAAQNTPWYQSATWSTDNQMDRVTAIYFVKRNDLHQNPKDTLVLVEGATLQEMYNLSGHFCCVIPVKSDHEQLGIDLSVPFLIRGKQWLYGCPNCSKVKSLDALSSLTSDVSWDAIAIANALGAEPLRYVLIMNFTMEDDTGSLDAYLWNHALHLIFLGWNVVFSRTILQMEQRNVSSTKYSTQRSQEESDIPNALLITQAYPFKYSNPDDRINMFIR